MKPILSLIRRLGFRFLLVLIALSMWTGPALHLCRAASLPPPILAPGAPEGSAASFLDDFFQGLVRESYDQERRDKMLAEAGARFSSMSAAAAELEPLLDYADPLRELGEAEREEEKIRHSTEGMMKRLTEIIRKTSELKELRNKISEAAEKLYDAHQEIRTAMRRACRETPSPRDGETVAAQSKKAVEAYALVKAAAEKAGRIKSSVEGELADRSNLEAAARRAEEAVLRVAEASDRVDEVFGGDAGPWLERAVSSFLCKIFIGQFFEERQILTHFSYRA